MRDFLKRKGVLSTLLFLAGSATGSALPPELIGPLSGWLGSLL